MAFNKDEMEAPAWMDKDFYETVLRQSEHDNGLVVDSYEATPGTKPGDHFASIIFRVSVSYQIRGEAKRISLIVKTIPEGEGLKRDLLKNSSLFPTEIGIYDKVLPEMYRALRTVGDNTEFGPSLLYFSSEPTWVMVFEDLTKRDYGMKYSQLDLDEAKILYTKLAKFHATSMYLADTVPAMKTFNAGLGSLINDEYVKTWIDNFSIQAKVCLQWPGYADYSERLGGMKDAIIKRIVEMYTVDEASVYNVINHGDSHFKNYMYQIDDGKTKDILLLDYQISVWGSAAIDLLYTMYMAINTETRNNHRDELIKFYHDEFTATLRKLGYLKKIPTLIELHVEMIKFGHLETFLITAFLPIVTLSPEEMMPQLAEEAANGAGVDLADQEQLTAMITRCFYHPKNAAMMQQYLPMLLRKGFLDFE